MTLNNVRNTAPALSTPLSYLDNIAFRRCRPNPKQKGREGVLSSLNAVIKILMP